MSNVAPPHISSEKQSARMSAVPSAPLSMSRVRRRVLSRDWCASRIVVSVMSSFFWPRTQSLTASGPSVSSRNLSPSCFEISRCGFGKRGVSYWWRSASGLLTWMLAMYLSTRVARSRDSVNSNSSGVSSMNFVWHLPAMNVGCVRMFVTNGMFVFTPRTCSSLMARVALRQTAGKVQSQLVTLTSRES